MRASKTEMPFNQEDDLTAPDLKKMNLLPKRWLQTSMLIVALSLGSAAVSPAIAKGKTASHGKAAAAHSSGGSAAKAGKAGNTGKATSSAKGGKHAAHEKSSRHGGRHAGRGARAAAGAAAVGAAAPMGLEHWTPSGNKSDQVADAKDLPAVRASAENGDAQAQYVLGSRYRFGHGVSQDLTLAVQWYRKSADQGYAPAQSDLGVMYANGCGVAAD